MGKKYSSSLLKKINFREVASSAAKAFLENSMHDFQEKFNMHFPLAEFSFHTAPNFDVMKISEASYNSSFGFNVARDIMIPEVQQCKDKISLATKTKIMTSASALFYQTDIVARTEDFFRWNSEPRIRKILEIGTRKTDELYRRMEIDVVDFIYNKVADEIAAAFSISREDYSFSFSKLLDNETVSLNLFRRKFFESDNDFACTKEVISRAKNICEPFVAFPLDTMMRDLNIMTGDFRSDFSVVHGVLIFPFSNVVYLWSPITNCPLFAEIEGCNFGNFKMVHDPENKTVNVAPENFLPSGYVPFDIVIGNLFNMLIVTVQNKTREADSFRIEFSRNGGSPKVLENDVNAMRTVSSYIMKKTSGRKDEIDRNIIQINSEEENFCSTLNDCFEQAIEKFRNDFPEMNRGVVFNLIQTNKSAVDRKTRKTTFPCVFVNFELVGGSNYINFKNGAYSVDTPIYMSYFMNILCFYDGVFPKIGKEYRMEGFMTSAEKIVGKYSLGEFMKIDSLDNIFEKLVEMFKDDLSESEKKMLREKLDRMLLGIKEMQSNIMENVNRSMFLKNSSLDFLLDKEKKIESGLLDKAVELRGENAKIRKRIRENEKSVFSNIDMKGISYDSLGVALSYLTGDEFSFMTLELWSSEDEKK